MSQRSNHGIQWIQRRSKTRKLQQNSRKWRQAIKPRREGVENLAEERRHFSCLIRKPENSSKRGRETRRILPVRSVGSGIAAREWPAALISQSSVTGYSRSISKHVSLRWSRNVDDARSCGDETRSVTTWRVFISLFGGRLWWVLKSFVTVREKIRRIKAHRCKTSPTATSLMWGHFFNFGKYVGVVLYFCRQYYVTCLSYIGQRYDS